jgi:large subunit ribosomal protein L25
MSQKELNISLRDKTGKGISRQLRRDGNFPGVVYGKGFESAAVSLNQKEFAKIIASSSSPLITLKGESSLNGAIVMIADILRDPIKGTLLHADLHKINMDEKVRVEVKIKFEGTAKGVKDGGLLGIIKHSIEVECLPTEIPESISVDISHLTIGLSVHAHEIKLPEGIKLMEDPNAAIVNVLGKSMEDETAAEAKSEAEAADQTQAKA